MKVSWIFILPLLGSVMLRAQGHQPVFPDLEGSALLEAVQTSFKPLQVLTYDHARDTLFGSIDKEGDSLYCIYTRFPKYLPNGVDPTQAVFDNGNGINTEHTWPQAFGIETSNARADMHHLFPSKADVNNDRSNWPFAEINDAQTNRWYYRSLVQSSAPPESQRHLFSEYRSNVAFEPAEAVKGNIARAIFYIYTIYRNEVQPAAPGYFEQQLPSLCAWHALDPVDEREWNRTWRVASYQDGKPNPFVLDCTLPIRMYCPEYEGFQCVTAVEEVGKALDFVVFPNPVSSTTFSVQIPDGLQGKVSWVLHSVQGQKMAEQHDLLVEGGQQLELPSPPPGWWLLTIVADGTSGKRLSVSIPVIVVR